MPNLTNVVEFPDLHSPDTERYIEGFGSLFVSFGSSASLGRLFGYLFLAPAPVSLDQVAHDLEASKSSISVAARQLELLGMTRRIPQRGSRRLLLEAVDPSEGWLETENQRRAMFLEKVLQGVAILPPGPGRRRLQDSADLLQFSLDESREMLARWRAKSRSRART
jgi:hypothetical protein